MASRESRVGRVALVVAAALAAMVAAAPTALAAGAAVTVGDAYDGGTLTLAPGDELRVRLASHTADGAVWAVAFGDEAVVKAQPAGGAAEPGFETLRFQAAAAGTASLGLVCRKASDPSAQPAGLFHLQVEVKEMMIRRKGVLLEEPDSGSIIYLAQGDSLSVRLASNPTTGYTWSVAANAASVLQPGGDPRFEPPPTPRPGSGGFQTFDFRVAGGGAALLQLVYRRPFEKDTPPARTWSVFVAAASLR